MARKGRRRIPTLCRCSVILTSHSYQRRNCRGYETYLRGNGSCTKSTPKEKGKIYTTYIISFIRKVRLIKMPRGGIFFCYRCCCCCCCFVNEQPFSIWDVSLESSTIYAPLTTVNVSQSHSSLYFFSYIYYFNPMLLSDKCKYYIKCI